MRGKFTFSQTEADQIIQLIKLKLQSNSNQQKGIRNKIRNLGFYASDFGIVGGCTERDFLNAVTILKENSVTAQSETGMESEGKVPIGFESRAPLKQIISFPPIVPPRPRILILGTMPGQRSLTLNQYYGHGGNRFWKIMMHLLNESSADTYDRKTQVLKERGVALWDVLKACVRESSADSDIQSEEPNDFPSFLSTNSTIKAIFFNGQKAYEFFEKHAGSVDIGQHVLPSTSPANSWATYEQKLEAWKKILDYL